MMEANALKKQRAEGREKGKAEGKEERNIEIAINMLESKLDLSLISRITGLSQEEILRLKHKNSLKVSIR